MGPDNGYFPGGLYASPDKNNTSSYIDLDVPDSSSGNVEDCFFTNSPSYSINAQYNDYVYGNQFQYVGYTAVIGYSTSAAEGLKVEDSGFSYIGGSAIVFIGISDGTIYANTSFNQVGYICFTDSGGGAIEVDATSNFVGVDNNYVDGGSISCSYPPANNGANQGLEMYGTNHQVYNNTFINNTAEGIRLASFSNITLYNNSLSNNGYGYTMSGVPFAGVGLIGSAGNPGCAPVAETATIQNNTIENNAGWGVMAQQDGCNGPNASTVTLSGNTIQGNGLGTVIFQ